jgi:hypothetical protein
MFALSAISTFSCFLSLSLYAFICYLLLVTFCNIAVVGKGRVLC